MFHGDYGNGILGQAQVVLPWLLVSSHDMAVANFGRFGAGFLGSDCGGAARLHLACARASQEAQQHNQRRHRIVEVAHSWFNRFRKLLMLYQNRERSFMALTRLAAAIIVFRKAPMKINIIYG